MISTKLFPLSPPSSPRSDGPFGPADLGHHVPRDGLIGELRATEESDGPAKYSAGLYGRPEGESDLRTPARLDPDLRRLRQGRPL